MQELTLAIVGIDFPNGNGSNRRSEIMMTLPGEPVELVPEPKNRHDSHAIAVVGPRGVQIGYVTAERAPYIGARIARGESVRAIFQALDGGSAFVRVRFGGDAPTLPDCTPDASSSPSRRSRRADDDPHGFYPDDDGPEWGA
ncbi:HIRAN domain-containing protein [Sphingomonadaceae bacterium OTU29THOMA1]|nr:HIRAN domain-containing protein [Sphingomonadaceae bacterium OTU29THOMA1]